MVLSIDCLHMPDWPFSVMSIHTTVTTATNIATTSTYNNDNSPNIRNGSFDDYGQISSLECPRTPHPRPAYCGTIQLCCVPSSPYLTLNIQQAFIF